MIRSQPHSVVSLAVLSVGCLGYAQAEPSPSGPLTNADRLHVDGHRFRNQAGTTVALYGVNRQAVVYGREGQAGDVSLRLQTSGAEGTGQLIDESDRVLVDGLATDLARIGVTVPLEALQCRVVR